MTGKKFDELTITDNFMFSKVMQNKELCRQFLEMVITPMAVKRNSKCFLRGFDI